MNERFKKALCEALIKSGADFNLMCIVASVGDTCTEGEATAMLDAYNANDGIWQEILASVDNND